MKDESRDDLPVFLEARFGGEPVGCVGLYARDGYGELTRLYAKHGYAEIEPYHDGLYAEHFFEKRLV